MRRGSGLSRKTPLKQGDKPLQTRRTLERRGELRAVSPRRLEAIEGGNQQPRRSTFRRRGTFTPASQDQRAKVKQQGCRVTAEHGPHVQPAHITPRSLGGCDDAECVAGLRADLHRMYDQGYDVGLLERLTFEEQAHAAEHLGLIGALQRITNQRWSPDDDPMGRAA